jgi:hypothetical protein
MRVRHVLPGVCSFVLIVTTATAQTTWTGAASNSWDNPFNWDTGLVPDSSTDVIIAAAVNQPSSYIFNPTCRDLAIESGATVSLVAGFDLAVAGGLVIASGGALSVQSTGSDVVVAGSWTNDGSFANGGALVELSGTGTLAGSATTVFQDLVLTGGVRSAAVDFTVDGDVTVEGGATLALGATALVRGNWSSAAPGAATTGPGAVVLDGTGLLTSGLNGLPNVAVVSGTRSVNPSTVTGGLGLVGGTLRVLDNASLIVGGDAVLLGGTLAFESTFPGSEILDVGGNALVTCTAGAFSPDVRILCAGDWTSSAAFQPAAGSVELDGTGTRTLSGAGLAFHNLRIASGTVQALSPVAVAATLVVDGGATLDADAAFTLAGGAVLGGASGAWDLGGLEHAVAGGWTSAGMSAIGGTIRFTGDGAVLAGGGSIASVVVAGGVRGVDELDVTGDLTVSGGELVIADGGDLTVGGDAHLVGGTLSFADTSAAADVLQIAGSVLATGTAVGAIGSSGQILCAGDWTSDGSFVPTAGVVRFTGPGTVGGSTATFHRVRVSVGTRTLAVPTTLTGDLLVDNGVALVSGAPIEVAGFVSLGNGTASWDLGGLTHTVGTDLSSNGAAFTNGDIALDGAGGTIDLGGGSLDALSILSGTRTVDAAALGSLALFGGELALTPAAVVEVAGDVTASGGALSLDTGARLAAAGSVDLTGVTPGTIGSASRIEFGASWTSTPSWAPTAGTTVFTGAGAGTVLSDASLFHLTVDSGVLTANGALAIGGDLRLGGELTSLQPSTVAGSVGFLAPVTWDLGGHTHVVSGNWTSPGGSAVNGAVEFDGDGNLNLGAGSIAGVVVSAGTRSASTGAIAGDLLVTGGTLRINQDQELTVQGDAVFTGGQVGWFPSPGGPDEVLVVEGDVDCDASAEFESTGSRFLCRGSWTSGPAFAPSLAAVVLDGAQPTTIGGAPSFFYLVCRNATRTLAADVQVRGNLVMQSGAQIDASAAVLDVDGSVSLEAGVGIELGALHHFVGGDLVLGDGTVTGTGTVELDGDGTLETGVGGSLSNALVSAGARAVNDTVIAGVLEMTGGAIEIAAGNVLTVNGVARLTGGTLSFEPAGAGFATLDATAVELSCAAGAMDASSLVLCSGDWSSTSAWSPAAGAVLLDGGGPGAVTGASPTFRDLVIFNGDKTVESPATIAGNLTVFNAESLTTPAPLEVLGNVTLLPDATWTTGQTTHVVHGDWTSTGATVASSAFLELAGNGILLTGTSTVPNVRVTGGTRVASTSTIRFSLELVDGALVIADNQTLTVQGDAKLSGGTLAFADQTAGPQTLLVEGDMVDLSATAGPTPAEAVIVARGDWSSSSAWAPADGVVRLEPAGAAMLAGARPTFANLAIGSGEVVVTTAATIERVLSVGSGALLTTQAALTANGGVDLGDATAAWDVGAVTHAVRGHWTSAGGSATGAGEIEFSGAGDVDTGGGSLPNVRTVIGTRTISAAEVAGDLVVAGGTLGIQDGALAHVSGDFRMTGGTLAFGADDPGLETLDVDGDVVIEAGLAGPFSAESEIRCGGAWTSPAAFAPVSGSIVLDGAGPATVGGAGLDLPRLVVAAGVHTLADAAALDHLEVASGARLVAAAAMDVGGSVTLGDATATLELGGLTHDVGGDWTSAGASAVDGTVEFDGTGTLAAGGGTLPDVRFTLGTRTVGDAAIAGDLAQSGGQLVLAEDRTLSVAGDATFSGGSIAWPVTANGTPDAIDVEGDVTTRSAVQSASADAVLRCAGDWTSNASFHMPAGAVVLDGAQPTSITGLLPGLDPTFARLVLSNGARAIANELTLSADAVQIQDGAELVVEDVHASIADGLVTVGGKLSVGVGGELDLGASVAAIVPPSGTLSLRGVFGEPAVLGGVGAGGYLLSIDGTLDATNFRIERVGPGGVVVAQTATIASLQAGEFARPSATPGSILLDVRRAAPTAFHYVDFEDPDGVGTTNVRTLGGAAITFVDSAGDFAGPAYEIDPLDLVTWVSLPTVVSVFTATPDADQVALAWTTTSEVEADAWVVQRATDAAGPFDDLVQLPAGGPGSYGHVDTATVAGTTYTYRLQEVKTHGERVDHGDVQATPWTSGLPDNVIAVGPSGAYPDVQSALAAVTGAKPVLRLAAGTYPAFTVGGGLGALRIFADGTGPVVIDTTLGSVVIQDLGPGDAVELSDLEIGSAGSPNEGIAITSCAGLVVLDELTVHGGAGQPGVHVTASTRVAVQRSAVDGAPGLVVESASVALVGRGALDELDVSGGSSVRLAEVAPAETVDGTSTVTVLPGVHADLDAPEFVSLGGTWDLVYDGAAGGLYVTASALAYGWFDLPAPFEMVGLINIAAAPQLTSGAIGATPTTQTLPMPADGVLFGATVALQMVVANPSTATVRWSNVASIVLID